MAKVSIVSVSINGRKTIRENNVTMVSIANYSSDEASFMFNGVRRILPPIDATYNVPVAPFEIQNSGHHFKIDIQFNASNTNIIVDYAQLDTPQIQSTNSKTC